MKSFYELEEYALVKDVPIMQKKKKVLNTLLMN